MKLRKHRGDRDFVVMFQTRLFPGDGTQCWSPPQAQYILGNDINAVRRAFLFGRGAVRGLIRDCTNREVLLEL